MGLLFNGHFYNNYPATFMGTSVNGEGKTSSGQSSWLRPGMVRNQFFGDTKTEAYKKSSIPVGYGAPYAKVLAISSGGLGVTNSSFANSGVVTANMAAGKNIEASLDATGTLTALQLQTVISMATTLAATGTITNAQLVSFVNMVSTLSCSGSLNADIGALSNLVATLQAIATMEPEMNATANMEADITPFTELSPENLAAAVWSALASQYNSSGTMGQKLNGAGSAGDPWTTDLTSYTTPGTAGKVLQDAKKKAALAAGLSA